eukprot:506923_1
MLRRVRDNQAARNFRQRFKQTQQNPLRDLVKYMIAIIIFFLLMYVFMHSVTFIPIGNEKPPSKSSINNISNKPKPDQKKLIIPLAAHKPENTKHARNDYIIFENYMATQVNGKSKGLFEKFESRHEHNLVQLYCDSLRDECIGYAFNKNGGYQFYSQNGWPMQKKNGWNFYMKHDQNKELSFKDTGLNPNHMDKQSKNKYLNNKSTENNKIIINEEIKPKYISYAQNVGRVNNQLVSFEAMIQYAIYYNRTLVIPWPRHQNHVMGFECNFWDFHKLNEVINIIMEDKLPQRLQNYRQEKDVPAECRFIKLIGKGISTESLINCEMIYLYEGDMGIFHFRDGPKDVMKYIIPAKYIRDAVEGFLSEEFGDQKTYRIGVHRRAMDEGGKDPKTGERHVCRWESRGIYGDSRFGWLRNLIKKVTVTDLDLYNKIIGMYHHSCAMDFNDLQNILVFHKQERIENNEKFFIAHDHQEQYVIDNMKEYGGIEQPIGKNKEKYSSYFWSKSEKCYAYHKSKCRGYGHCSTQNTLKMKEEILFDMWALYFADFLAGTWMSTLTRTVCHWKGFDYSLYNGNQCFLKWKWEDTVNGKNNNWYTLDNLNETALFD